jgi:hypothetical protein
MSREPFPVARFQEPDYNTKDKRATTLPKEYGSSPVSCAKRLREIFKQQSGTYLKSLRKRTFKENRR